MVVVSLHTLDKEDDDDDDTLRDRDRVDGAGAGGEKWTNAVDAHVVSRCNSSNTTSVIVRSSDDVLCLIMLFCG